MKNSVLLFILCYFLQTKALIYDEASGTFDEVDVLLAETRFNASKCPEILEDIKSIFKSASKKLSEDLNQRFGKVNLRIPKSWTNEDCYTEGHIKDHQPSDSQEFDLIFGPYDPHGTGYAWTQQSLGCHQKADYVYIPTSKLNQSLEDLDLFHQWNRFNYGLFTDDSLSENVTSGSRQDSFCLGESALSIVRPSTARNVNPKFAYKLPKSDPNFVISREMPSKYVIVLENSIAMNINNSWELLRTGLRKFINQDLLDPQTQVGLVLFNEAASIKNTVQKVGDKHSNVRKSLDSNIPFNKRLSHKYDSCVRCGVVKAIEALQTSGSTIGANIILISQGHINVLSREDDREVLHLAERHKLRIFTLPFIEKKNNISILFESLSFKTKANSFFINPIKMSEMDVYMGIIDALREIQARSESNIPALVHEKVMEASSMKLEERGSFYIDQHIGNNTQFHIYTMGDREDSGHIKSITINDRRQTKYSSITDYFLHYHYMTILDQVPYNSDRNLNMLWNYNIEKYQDAPHDQKFALQVVSLPRIDNEQIRIKFWTNHKNSHSIHINESHPLKFFVSVNLNNIPIIEAKVNLKIKVISHAKTEETEFEMELFDNGNGDPDVKSNDGIYSRYFTNFTGGEGRYEIEILVENIDGTAFSYQPLTLKESQSSVVMRTVELASFTRIVKGESFRIMSLAPKQNYSPARILNLSAFVHFDKGEVQLAWTAPGEILDHGKVFSYKIFISEASQSFYKKERTLLRQIAAVHPATALERYDLKFEDIGKNDVYLAIAAVNNFKKMSELSNVVHIKLPYESTVQENLNWTQNEDYIQIEAPDRKSDKILFYVLFSIIAVLLVSILAIVAIMKKFSGKSSNSSNQDPLEDFDIIDVTDEDAIVQKTNMTTLKDNDITMPTFYKSNISILKNANEESLCNCHEINNDQDLVCNPYINYSSLNRSAHHIRQEPIYANTHVPIYSTVNKKNVRIVVENDTESETQTEEEIEEEERCLTPSNTYLELSFEGQNQAQAQTPKQQNNLFKNSDFSSSTPNTAHVSSPAKIRTITRV